MTINRIKLGKGTFRILLPPPIRVHAWREFYPIAKCGHCDEPIMGSNVYLVTQEQYDFRKLDETYRPKYVGAPFHHSNGTVDVRRVYWPFRDVDMLVDFRRKVDGLYLHGHGYWKSLCECCFVGHIMEIDVEKSMRGGGVASTVRAIQKKLEGVTTIRFKKRDRIVRSSGLLDTPSGDS